MILAEFETLLKQTLGLDATSIGSSAIEYAVQKRLVACQLEDWQAYWELVRTSEDELQALIEAVVVPETWFFRDQESFAALARLVIQEWWPLHPEGVLRLLSLPCSTGEEPYSMAMALFDAGLPRHRFRIDAMDISDRVLRLARLALYGKNSFRGQNLGFRDRYFEATAEGYHLTEQVCQQVHFQQGNVFDSDLLPGREGYDIIFCRNMLIYFDRATQDRVVQVLERLLAPKGILFVGPSETALLLSHNFASTKIPLAFAFRRGEIVSPPSQTLQPAKKTLWLKRKTILLRKKTMKISAPTRIRTSIVEPPLKPSPSPSWSLPSVSSEKQRIDLERADQLANDGRLEEAAKCCEEFLRTYGASAKALYLLGLVRDAAGQQVEAAGFYRKALYLDPHHHEALLHLALLLEKQGDQAGAKVLNDRVQRLEQKLKN
jgi:chemotaxis protein methyltransferase WspC